MAVDSRIAELEQKYIELLEKKVARLESEKESGKESGKDSEKNSKDGKSAALLSRKNSASSVTAVNGDVSESSKVTAKDGSSTAESNNSQRIRFRDRKFNTEGFTEETDGAPIIKEGKENPGSTAHAMTVLRAFKSDGKYDYSVINIDDDGLRALLLHVLAHHPWLSHLPTPLSFYSLFEPIVHNWSLLNDFACNNPSRPAVSDLYSQLKLGDSSLTGTSGGLLAPLMAAGSLEKATADLKLLLDEVRRTPGLESYFNGAREMQEKTSTVSFEYLWTIFPPGELVFSSVFMDCPQAFIVKYCRDNYTRSGSSGEKWILECWTYDWNGTTFYRVPVEFSFEDFKGTKSITSLPCYPLKFSRETSDDAKNASGVDLAEPVKQKLIKRGERYRELCLKKKGWQLFDYEGDLVTRGTGVRKIATRQHDTDLGSSSSLTSLGQHSEARPETPSKKQRIKKDRVMVDFGSYIQHGPDFTKFPPMGDVNFVIDDDDSESCKCTLCSANDKLKENQKPHYDQVSNAAGWDETQLLICPPRLLGYHLKGKRWVELDVNNVKNIKKLKDTTSFEQLQLNRPQKNLIQNLVACHASGSENKNRTMSDLSQGKGNGLVILLHGPPGVGKTLTAESVAEASGKPLFAVSVSDIGLDPTEVETVLQRHFELAATWRAVMLFDEADVFLESRSSTTANLDRNALVSILLRVLEYYDGILIVTTNRLRTFDIAVQSRVNFAIRYKDLDDKQKKAIYKNFIEQLTEDNTYDKQQLLSWLDDDEEENGVSPFKELNGRQIRNVLFSAASIAQGDSDKRLKLDHIKKMLRETTNFVKDMEYMVQMARGEAEVAYSKK